MRQPNYGLALALAAVGWNHSETARRINAQALRRGLRGVAVDHSRVSRWIRLGEKPRSPVPELLAAVLSEETGQVYTAEDLGIGVLVSIRIWLDEAELRQLAAGAATLNMTAEDYVRGVLRRALTETPTDRAGSPVSAQLGTDGLSAGLRTSRPPPPGS